MNDNSRRGSQWQRLIGEFFIPQFGGTPEKWAEANRGIVEKIITEVEAMYSQNRNELPEGYYEWEHTIWIDTMFNKLGIEPPKNKIELSMTASKWITPQVDASYPGIIATIHQLAEEYTLYTASNEVSYELEGYLTGMGVNHHFQQFYGADLVNAMKTSPLYFQRILEQTGIKPEESVFIDDNYKNLRFAKETGFHVIHSGLSGSEKQDFPYFQDPQEIPNLINAL